MWHFLCVPVTQEDCVKNSRIVIFSLLAISWLLAVSIRGLAIPVLARFEVGDPQVILGLNATTLAAVILGTGSFLILNRHPLVVSFANEVVDELRKVTWPDKDDTVQNTVIVIGVTLFIAFALGLYDYVWAEVTQIVLFSQS
jgi:preprotein translocase subunit SecE